MTPLTLFGADQGPEQAAQPAVRVGFDLRQQRCGQVFFWMGETRIREQDHTDGVATRVEQCTAWRLGRPGSDGRQWRPCWHCKTTDAPVGETYQQFLDRQTRGRP